MKISKYKSLALTTMLFLIITILCKQVNNGQYRQSDFFILFTFSINITLFVYKLISSIRKHAFSLDMMFWLFNVFFMGVAPLLQYLSDIYMWSLNPTSYDIIRSNILILVWSLFYILGQHIKKEENEQETGKAIYTIRKNAIPILLSASIIITYYYLYAIGFKNLLFRSTNIIVGQNQMNMLITTHTFRNIVICTATLAMIDANKRGKITISLIIALICLLITCFPTGIERYMLAAFYLGLFINSFKKTRKGCWFSIVIIIGLVLVFPAINIFRNVLSSSNTNVLKMISDAIQNTYLEGHYDAHQMFISVQHYVQKFGITYMKQFLGTVFFFIPRIIWETKPFGTGYTVITKLNQNNFTNVSAPLISEAYINLGIWGIIIAGVFLGKLIKQIDCKYWNNENDLSLIRIIYPFSIFYFFFLLRGDLLSSWSYLFAQIFVGYMIWKFAIKKESVKNK